MFGSLGQRLFAEVPGLVDLEIFTEDNALLAEPRKEFWPIECLIPATQEQMDLLTQVEAEKLEKAKTVHEEASVLMKCKKSKKAFDVVIQALDTYIVIIKSLITCVPFPKSIHQIVVLLETFRKSINYAIKTIEVESRDTLKSTTQCNNKISAEKVSTLVREVGMEAVEVQLRCRVEMQRSIGTRKVISSC